MALADILAATSTNSVFCFVETTGGIWNCWCCCKDYIHFNLIVVLLRMSYGQCLCMGPCHQCYYYFRFVAEVCFKACKSWHMWASVKALGFKWFWQLKHEKNSYYLDFHATLYTFNRLQHTLREAVHNKLMLIYSFWQQRPTGKPQTFVTANLLLFRCPVTSLSLKT